MLIPTFRNEAEAAAYAEVHQPLRNAMGGDVGREYGLRYGNRAAGHADRCRDAARKGNQPAHWHAMYMLSLTVNPPVARKVS